MGTNLILTGFSGTGKTQVGRLIARLLGWDFVDTDQEIARETGKTIPQIFEQNGEAAFRHLEQAAVARACASTKTVVSTGGGTIVDPESYRAMVNSGVIVCLEATPETIARRLQRAGARGDPAGVRPLLGGPEPLKRIRQLKAERQTHYDKADWKVHTDGLALKEVAHQAIQGWSRRALGAQSGRTSDALAPNFVVEAASAEYPVFVDWGLLGDIGQYLRSLGIRKGPVFVITDSNVAASHGERTLDAMRRAGITPHVFTVPAGEASKSLATAESIYSWLAENRCERGHTIVALGGGVVGDLAGFVAATFLRGLALVQVPTSLAAMVDASIGGKTGVNLRQGKNLVGAFYQPRMVIADLETLKTLPSRELASGWAEAIKHGLILDAPLFHLFEERSEALCDLDAGITADVVRRSMAIKARVVEEDERETLGRRMILNYGHTIGHGLEAATAYTELLHGEAVAIGMRAAAWMSCELGLLSPEVVERQASLLGRFGLLASCPSADPQRVLEAMQLDKKASGKKINWVLLKDIGQTLITSDVPDDLVRAAVANVCR